MFKKGQGSLEIVLLAAVVAVVAIVVLFNFNDLKFNLANMSNVNMRVAGNHNPNDKIPYTPLGKTGPSAIKGQTLADMDFWFANTTYAQLQAQLGKNFGGKTLADSINELLGLMQMTGYQQVSATNVNADTLKTLAAVMAQLSASSEYAETAVGQSVIYGTIALIDSIPMAADPVEVGGSNASKIEESSSGSSSSTSTSTSTPTGTSSSNSSGLSSSSSTSTSTASSSSGGIRLPESAGVSASGKTGGINIININIHAPGP